MDEFLHFSIEEGGLDVNLITVHVEIVDESKEDSDGILVSDSRIELIVVDSFFLQKSFRYPSSLVGGWLTSLSIDLPGEDPLGSERFRLSVSPIDHGSDLVLIHLVEFGLDSLLPFVPLWRSVDFLKSLRDGRGDECMTADDGGREVC